MQDDRQFGSSDHGRGSESFSVKAISEGRPGWHDQYARMLRARRRLEDYALGLVPGSNLDDGLDPLYHFVQDAYHLKDWIKNDPNTGAAAGLVEVLFRAPTGPPVTRLCADLCNAAKHRMRDRHERFSDSEVLSQSVTSCPTANLAHSWEVHGDGVTYEGREFADQVIAVWNSWLLANGLPTP